MDITRYFRHGKLPTAEYKGFANSSNTLSEFAVKTA